LPRPSEWGEHEDALIVELDVILRLGVGTGRIQLGRVGAPEIEYVVADGPDPGSWTGLAGMVEGTREFLSTWENLRRTEEAAS
jgi:hypothetical protein